MERAYGFLEKATKFLIVVGEEILEDTEFKRPKGVFDLWEKFPKCRRELIEEVYS
jgi:hypothetical protein